MPCFYHCRGAGSGSRRNDRLQPFQGSAVGLRRLGLPQTATRRPVEHPIWYLETATHRIGRRGAPEYPAIPLDRHSLDEDLPTEPWMPRIENLPLLGLMGFHVVQLFNTVRPHPALGGATPAEVYSAGPHAQQQQKSI
jgi:hypothetical protein